jgi:hypothetical protein
MRTPLELLKTYTENVQDLEFIGTLFAEDGALELPYLASIGLPPRAEGPEQIKEFLRNLITTLTDFKFQLHGAAGGRKW